MTLWQQSSHFYWRRTAVLLFDGKPVCGRAFFQWPMPIFREPFSQYLMFLYLIKYNNSIKIITNEWETNFARFHPVYCSQSWAELFPERGFVPLLRCFTPTTRGQGTRLDFDFSYWSYLHKPVSTKSKPLWKALCSAQSSLSFSKG